LWSSVNDCNCTVKEIDDVQQYAPHIPCFATVHGAVSCCVSRYFRVVTVLAQAQGCSFPLESVFIEISSVAHLSTSSGCVLTSSYDPLSSTVARYSQEWNK
jgi:hypothetical protein